VPFTLTDWKRTFDGENISLRPSIGNWTLKRRSHYVIDHGKVIEAGTWSDEQVEAEQGRDCAAKARFYGQPPSVDRPLQTNPPKATPTIWAASGIGSRGNRNDRPGGNLPSGSVLRAIWRRADDDPCVQVGARRCGHSAPGVSGGRLL
jgi:hypothetical protein